MDAVTGAKRGGWEVAPGDLSQTIATTAVEMSLLGLDQGALDKRTPDSGAALEVVSRAPAARAPRRRRAPGAVAVGGGAPALATADVRARTPPATDQVPPSAPGDAEAHPSRPRAPVNQRAPFSQRAAPIQASPRSAKLSAIESPPAETESNAGNSAAGAAPP